MAVKQLKVPWEGLEADSVQAVAATACELYEKRYLLVVTLDAVLNSRREGLWQVAYAECSVTCMQWGLGSTTT